MSPPQAGAARAHRWWRGSAAAAVTSAAPCRGRIAAMQKRRVSCAHPAPLFRCRPVRPQLLYRQHREVLAEANQIGRKAGEGRGPLVAALVHVEGAIDLELDRMEAGGRVTVM